ncbi:MAG: M48 family metallopeptidase [Pseudomonadota bacterium]
MCLCHALSRRRLLLGGSAAALMLPLGGCVGTAAGAGAPTIVSDDQVRQAGLRSWQQIVANTPASSNAAHIAAANAASGRLLRAAGEAPGAWEVRVFAGDEINAFALPGRKIGIYDGLFRVADTPDQLATVVGHEIGHVQARHGAQRLNNALATSIGLDLIGTALSVGNMSGAREIGAALGVGAELGILRPYSRRQELEADAFGLRLMDAAGYDAREAITLWQDMARVGGSTPELISTHPAPATRIEEMRGLIAQLA